MTQIAIKSEMKSSPVPIEARIQRAVYCGDVKNACKRVRVWVATFPDGVVPPQQLAELMRRLEFASDYIRGTPYPGILTAILQCASEQELTTEFAIPSHIHRT